MQKTYSLLRNNKQSGPYTLEELLQLKLKPFDLVWVDGKSAGWSYPSEIDALKIYVADIPKPIETEHAALSTQSPEQNIVTPPPAKEIVLKKSTASTTAKNIYISLPAGSHVKENSISVIPRAENIEEEESPEARLERKAQELRNRIQAFSESKKQPKADNDLDTKYARSLDDIKEEYSSWLYQQRNKKNVVPKKTLFMIAGIAALFIGVYFLTRLSSVSKTNEEHILSAEEIKSTAPVFDASDKKENGLEKNKKLTKDPGKKSQKIKNNKTKPLPVKIISPKNSINKIDSYIDSLNKVERKKQQQKETDYEHPVVIGADTRQSSKRNNENVTNKPTERNATSYIPFEELVKLSESTGSGSPHLTLYNNSNKHIKFVAIDAFYYRANKKLLQKKTLYFNNISAMSTATLYVPLEKKAASVRYEMGLISTEGGLYYAKQ